MNETQGQNSKQTNIVYAVVISLSAIAIPVYFLWSETWDEFELSPLAVIIPFFYVVIVTGFMLMALNIKIKTVTSQETDEKMANKYHGIQKTVTPYILFALACYIIWVAYTIWQHTK